MKIDVTSFDTREAVIMMRRRTLAVALNASTKDQVLNQRSPQRMPKLLTMFCKFLGLE